MIYKYLDFYKLQLIEESLNVGISRPQKRKFPSSKFETHESSFLTRYTNKDLKVPIRK